MKKVSSIFLALGLSAGLVAGQEVAVKSKETTTLQKVKKVLNSKPVKVAAGVALVAVGCYVMFMIIGRVLTIRRPRSQSVVSASTVQMSSEDRSQWQARVLQATEANKDELLEEFLGFSPALRDLEGQATIESGKLILRFKSNPSSRSFWERWSLREQAIFEYTFPLNVPNAE